jgi:large subunit ribosomal protein L9
MEIILLEKIQNVGELGDLVTVKNGYARNYLIPQKKAMLATADAKEQVEEKRRQLAEGESDRLATATERADKAVRAITLVRLCGEEGQLYGSVSPIDIAEAMVAAGSEIEKSEVTQPDGPIKHTGSFQADVILHPEVRFTVDITVEGEQGEGDPMAEVEVVEPEENTDESAD